MRGLQVVGIDRAEIFTHGGLDVTPSGGTGVFTYQWYYNAALSSPVPAPEGTATPLENLPAGTYWAEVTDNNSPFLNCAVTSRFDVIDDIATVVIARADVDPGEVQGAIAPIQLPVRIP